MSQSTYFLGLYQHGAQLPPERRRRLPTCLSCLFPIVPQKIHVPKKNKTMSAVWDVTNESVTAGASTNHVRIVHDGLKLCMRLADGRDVEVDLRTALHVAEALHLPTRVDQSTPGRQQGGEYVGVQRSKAGGYVAFYKGTVRSPPSVAQRVKWPSRGRVR